MDLTTSTLYPFFSNVAMIALIISLEYPAGIIITAAQIRIRSSGYEVKSYDIMQKRQSARGNLPGACFIALSCSKRKSGRIYPIVRGAIFFMRHLWCRC